MRQLRRLVLWCYGPARLPDDATIVQFNIRIDGGPWWRRWLAPQARFRLENRVPFGPYPKDHAFALLEWGTNWAIAARANQFLMLHAGVVERRGQALLLPALPGSGKTTLTAALAFRGWRFLSDEFALVDLRSGLIHPLPRAAPLKNASIEIIRSFAPEAEIGPRFQKTRKGDVAHLRPPHDALRRQLEVARPAWVVFPRFRPGASTRIGVLHKSHAFTRLAQNAFNYRLLGAAGFDRLRALVSDARCLSAEYAELDSITQALDHMSEAES